MNHATDFSQDNVSRFDAIAAEWDEEPRRTALALAVARAIRAAVRPQGSERTLEFGAGTGLVTALLAPAVGEIVAADNSAAMLDVLEAKRRTLGLDNVRTQRCDLARELPEGRFDLVCSSMTLHHIADVAGLFARLAAAIEPGGWLAVADLDVEGGTFHADPKGIAHHGFARSDIERWLREAGFEDVGLRTVHVVRRVGADGRERDYPVFLATARKTR